MESFYTMLLLWIVIGGISAVIAKQKHRNPIAWFFIGLLFSFFGLLTLLILPSKPLEKKPEIARAPCMEAHNAAAIPPDEEFAAPSHEVILRISTNPSIDWYYVNPELKTEGPFKLKELRREVVLKKLGDETLIWCEELVDWTPIGNFHNRATVFDKDLVEDAHIPPKSTEMIKETGL